VAEDVVIETHNLTKRYGARIVAVDDLHLQIRRGEVYGFLGPNGAGKTTTLRMLLGLIRPTAGTARVLGKPPGDVAGLARLGALVEAPTFYPYLSGRDNLRVCARYDGVSNQRVEEVLALVELTPRARSRFRAYSLGMKQRLGVAAALLKDPELLILDEPTNGLDPAGMADMRRLIRTLGDSGHTVVLSSHNMSEVEQVCDRVGVIRGGRLIAEGTVSELRARGGPPDLLVRADPLDEAQRLLPTLLGRSAVTVDGGALRVTAAGEHAGAINRELVAAGVTVSELRPIERTLEDVFFTLTEGQSAGAESIRGGKEA
jgi:ABC-2 type transport system ATP-binding protein